MSSVEAQACSNINDKFWNFCCKPQKDQKRYIKCDSDHDLSEPRNNEAIELGVP